MRIHPAQTCKVTRIAFFSQRACTTYGRMPLSNCLVIFYQ